MYITRTQLAIKKRSFAHIWKLNKRTGAAKAYLESKN
jgi:hypothetical protein